jgi:hypothetical protein
VIEYWFYERFPKICIWKRYIPEIMVTPENEYGDQLTLGRKMSVISTDISIDMQKYV